LPITCGAPQGSVLGPLLFLIYINDFVNASSILEFHLFADASNLFYSQRDLDHLEQSVNQELKKINTWLCVNKLSLTIATSHFVIFRPYQKKVNSQIKIEIEGKLINERKIVKYLGVLLDCNLNWKEHIQQITKKVSRGIGVFCKMRYFGETKVLIQLYHAIILPFISYSCLIWGSTYSSNLNPLYIMQKKTIRITHFPHSMHILVLCSLSFLFSSFRTILNFKLFTLCTNLKLAKCQATLIPFLSKLQACIM